MPNKLTEVQSVRIICDSVLKDGLLRNLNNLGATGWTWWMAHGRGEHPTDAGFLNEMLQLYVEIWCDAEVAERIIEYCTSSHFSGIGMSVGVTPLFVSPQQAAGLAARKSSPGSH